MKLYIFFVIGSLSLSAFCFLDYNKNVFKKLYALEGNWQMKTKKIVIGEEWKKIDKKYLQSKGYYIKGIDTIITERVSLMLNNNDILYTSTVENQNNNIAVAFKLTAFAKNKFVFENPKHDYPKRIVYELISKDSIHAFIDDAVDSSKKIQHFYYKKVSS